MLFRFPLLGDSSVFSLQASLVHSVNPCSVHAVLPSFRTLQSTLYLF